MHSQSESKILAKVKVEVITENQLQDYDLDRIIHDLDKEIDFLSANADQLDYLIAIASGTLCAMLDILWTGDFDLGHGRGIASEQVDAFVIKTAQLLGCKGNDIAAAVRCLEKRFPLASDGNTPDFGGGRQHHLRDFAHHPTIAGLMFSLLTQFTGKSYGTDVNGVFLVVDVPANSRDFIGKDIPTKIIYGTITWFFHLVSDMAGSSSSAGISGGTGIPGPILSMMKEMSTLPFFKNVTVGDIELSKLLSKLFNGTLFAVRDENNKIMKDSVYKLDFRGELGIGVEFGRQTIPVVANDCFVRCLYFFRRFARELRLHPVTSLSDFARVDWNSVFPGNNPTIARMLMVAAGVFSTIDVGEAIVSKKYFIAVNYIGVGRFAMAIGADVQWGLAKRDVKKIKAMYEEIKRFMFQSEDNRMYETINMDVDIGKFGLTVEQVEILYNLEARQVINDIVKTKMPFNTEKVKSLKEDWLNEWKSYIAEGFSSFVKMEGMKIHWYSEEELFRKIEENEPWKPWLRLAMLETMLLEPYYPLSLEADKKGNMVPDKKYTALQNPIAGYNKTQGDQYLESFFCDKSYYTQGYIKRLRKCYNSVLGELNEVQKAALTFLGISALVAMGTIATAGMFAPSIAVALVGSNFAGLNGAALTSACLAYIGGGAVAFGGAGMAGGTIAIVGGGAALGLGMGVGVGGAVSAIELTEKKNIILQSAKLLTSVREIFLNDEHDTLYSNSVYEQYVQNIATIEKELVDLRLRCDVATKEERAKLQETIKQQEKTVEAMKIARKSLNKFIGSFEEGLSNG